MTSKQSPSVDELWKHAKQIWKFKKNLSAKKNVEDILFFVSSWNVASCVA